MNVSQRVENILDAVPATRSSDKELLIIYMQKAGMDLTPGQIKLFKSLPSMETIRRIRQKLQEDGKYPASKQVEDARYRKYVEAKGSIGVTNATQLEELLDGTTVLADGTRVLPYGQ